MPATLALARRHGLRQPARLQAGFLPAGSVSADRIELRGLRASGYCGLLPEELERAQPLEVDLDVELDLAPAASTDALDDTVDYGALCSSVERVITTERFQLLERLAGRICEVVLDDERVAAVEVGVRKLRPPVPQQLATSGVRLRRVRP